MRKPVIAGNWKMYKTVSEAVDTALALKPLVANANHCEVVIAPVFTAIKTVADRLEGSNVRVSGQDCSTETKEGAHTGEVLASMLRDVGARYVIVGHSERRTFFGERDEDVRKKVLAVLRHGLSPILCVGESLAEREAGRTESVVTAQLSGGLAGLTTEDLATVTLAYEPIWAIGTERPATTEQAASVHRSLRSFTETGWDSKTASAMRILYGGSVTPKNIESLLASDAIDGALVGGACLLPDSFAKIVAAAQTQRV